LKDELDAELIVVAKIACFIVNFTIELDLLTSNNDFIIPMMTFSCARDSFEDVINLGTLDLTLRLDKTLFMTTNLATRPRKTNKTVENMIKIIHLISLFGMDSSTISLAPILLFVSFSCNFFPCMTQLLPLYSPFLDFCNLFPFFKAWFWLIPTNHNFKITSQCVGPKTSLFSPQILTIYASFLSFYKHLDLLV
jgi:hypothetical protein